jgi:hypothetical protein
MLGHYWWQALDANPVVTIPTPTMPSPNAYDYYVKACQAMVHQQQVDDEMMGGSSSKGAGSGLPVASTYTLAQKVALVKANVPALKLLHQGFAYAYQRPPAPHYTILNSHHADFRAMARLLGFVAETKAAQGDWNGAVNSRLDSIRLGEDISRGGAVIGMLVGIAVEKDGGKDIGKMIDHLNALQARAAARRMEDILVHRMPFAEVVQDEKWSGVKLLQETFRNPKWRGSFLDAIRGGGDDELEDSHKSRLQRVRQALRMYFVNKRQVVNSYMRYMDQEIANARQPYAAHLPDPPVPNDPINEITCAPVLGFERVEVATASHNAQILLILTLRAYRMEHDHYPDKLSELVPAYLHRLPDDPTALQGTFGYQRNQDTYLLFSNNSVNQNTAGGQTQPTP